jgi:hypothetical protein
MVSVAHLHFISERFFLMARVDRAAGDVRTTYYPESKRLPPAYQNYLWCSKIIITTDSEIIYHAQNSSIHNNKVCKGFMV